MRVAIFLAGGPAICKNLELPEFISRDLACLHYIDLDKRTSYDYVTDKVIGLKIETKLASGNRVYGSSNINLEDVEKAKKEFNDLSFKWCITQDQKDLIVLLEDAGFRYDSSYSLMVLDCTSIKVSDEYGNIKTAETPEDVNKWIEIYSQADDISFEDTKKFVQYLIKNTNENSIKLYLGFLDNKPVGTSIAILHDDCITIHGVSVIPEYRKRGLGYALSCKPLIDLKEKVSKAYLIATEDGKSIYKKIGFIEYLTCYEHAYSQGNSLQ